MTPPAPGEAPASPPAPPPEAPAPLPAQPASPPPPGAPQAYPYYYPPPYYGYGGLYSSVPPPPPPPKEPYNQAYMTAGIVMTVTGIVSLVVGSAVTTVARARIDIYCDGPVLCTHIDEPKMRDAGVALMIGGGVAATVGIPLWIIGGRRVPVRKRELAPQPAPAASAAPVLRVGPTGASLAVRF